MYEVLHLKSLILEEKNRFISDLENQATLGQFLQAKDESFAFQAMHVAVQAMLLLLELVMRAQEFKIVFQDFKLRLDALALYLEHGVEERVVYLSIYNYSLVYLAYPALLTGCVGMLAGFWQRRGAALSHRYRITLAVVLPLMLLNLCGIGMTVAWTQIGSCDVIQLVGREVLSHYISTLEGISVDSLLIELHGLKIKAKPGVMWPSSVRRPVRQVSPPVLWLDA
nr:hypothetical protein BaRGS_034367 [Batillaria attramentaria]